MRKWLLTMAAALSISAICPLYAQEKGNRVTCTGTLVDVWLKPRDPWPLAVIYDEIYKYTCAIDRDNANTIRLNLVLPGTGVE